jgi:hypothetical protein
MLNKNNLPKIKNGTLNPIQLKKSINPLLSKNLNTEKSNTLKMTINCDSQVYKTEKEKISDFLKSLNLENYTDLFVNKGINSEEKLQLINYDILKLLKIPYAHCKRILRKINDIQKNDNNKKSKLENNNKYEEIICPKEEDDIEENEEEQRKTFYKAISDFKKTNSNFFSKEENKKLNANETIEMSFEDNNEEKQNEYKESLIGTGEYIENSVNTEIDNNIINNIKKDNKKIISKDKSIGTTIKKNDLKIDISKPFKEARQFFPLNKTKTLCHQCLHMILQDHCIQKYNKLFCSLHCLEVFESKNITFCGNCKKKIEIVYAFPSIINKLIYYCSNECLNKIEPNEYNNINKSQIINPEHIKNAKSDYYDNNEPVDILDL